MASPSQSSGTFGTPMNTLSSPQTGLLPQVTHPRNPGMALNLDWPPASRLTLSYRTSRYPARTPQREEGISGCLASRPYADRPHHARRRHRRPRPAPLRKACQPVAPMLSARCRPDHRRRLAPTTRWPKCWPARFEGTQVLVAATSTGFPAGLALQPASPRSAKASALSQE